MHASWCLLDLQEAQDTVLIAKLLILSLLCFVVYWCSQKFLTETGGQLSEAISNQALNFQLSVQKFLTTDEADSKTNRIAVFSVKV